MSLNPDLVTNVFIEIAHETIFYQTLLACLRKVIVIAWVVRLNIEIIHELKRVDYLTYRWTKHGITILYHLH